MNNLVNSLQNQVNYLFEQGRLEIQQLKELANTEFTRLNTIIEDFSKPLNKTKIDYASISTPEKKTTIYPSSRKVDEAIGIYRSNGAANGRVVFLGARNGIYYKTSNYQKVYLNEDQKLNSIELY